VTIDRETIEALRDEPELLAIADAVRSAGAELGPATAPRPRRRLARIAAVALAAAAVVGFLLTSPWESGGPSFVDKALAAVGNRPVLHVVVRYTIGERIDLRTGASSPAHRDGEVWYDTARHVFRAVARIDGRVAYRSSGKGSLADEPFLLTTLYRKALQQGKLRKVGHAVVRGRRALVVQARVPHGGLMRDYLDAQNFRLLRLQYFLDGRLGYQLDVLRFETVSREEARLPKHPAPLGPSSRGSGTVSAPLTGSGSAVVGEAALVKARTVFGRPALWPGRAIAGHRLIASQLEEESSATRGRTVRGRKLFLRYGPRSRAFEQAYLEIEEAPASSPLWAVEDVAVPRSGYLDLLSSQTSTNDHDVRTQWTGTMTRAGLTLQLTSWSRTTLIAAARSLRPVP
jgi:hypothetical protein